MKNSRMFFIFWVINSALFYALPFVLGESVVTGNARLAPFMASIISGFLLSLAISVVQPAFESLKIRIKTEWHWALIFLVVNILSVWIIARYADLTGVGVANVWAAVAVGIIANIVQWAVWKFVDTKKK